MSGSSRCWLDDDDGEPVDLSGLVTEVRLSWNNGRCLATFGPFAPTDADAWAAILAQLRPDEAAGGDDDDD